ncbi:hypothetical protein [Clostridium sp. DL1XJH146]
MIKTGKEIMLNYCQTILSHNIEELQACKDIENGLIKNDFENYLGGYCPNSFGLENYEGKCCFDDIADIPNNMAELKKRCKSCWQIALNQKFETDKIIFD